MAARSCFALAKLHRAVAHDLPEPSQYDTPVPAPGRAANDAPNPEAAAIGDIAPRELRVAAGSAAGVPPNAGRAPRPSVFRRGGHWPWKPWTKFWKAWS